MAKTTTGSARKGVLTIALSIGPRPSKQKLTLNIESKLSADHHIVGKEAKTDRKEAQIRVPLSEGTLPYQNRIQAKRDNH